MYFSRKRWGFDWRELFTGVLFVIAGIFLFIHPGAGLVTLALMFGAIAIIRGITAIASFFKMRAYTPHMSWVLLLSGIIDVLLGLLFLFNVPAGIMGVSILFAIWFVIDSVANLVNVGHLRRMSTLWFVISLALDILTLLLAILLLMQPVVAAVSFAMLVAIYLVLFGINAIVIAFARSI
ncbi:HdeD family acid-resistance protein [Lacticaseibacillus zhaodongensis]|uniref:HdeD family acid-resistance protein n=1 Tax=Lacticaseibacillus zhaodongensis TaxID=2668065 RepID=UPI0012D32F32|nr:DUF308 domain-containing protein [Lacticaseibacillus zhaodongensis]